MIKRKHKRLLLLGRSEAGKTTLTQAIRGQTIDYAKTQCIAMDDLLIDTPGEYIQTKSLGAAIAIYSYEAAVFGLLISATEPYSLYPPCITCMTPKEVIGIVTKIDHKNANIQNAEKWLRLAGCKNIFFVNSTANQGIDEIKEHLGWIDKTNKSTEKK